MLRDLQPDVATGRICVGLHHVELHLEAELRLVAERPPCLDGSLQRGARRNDERRAIELEVSDHDIGVDLPPWAARLDQGYRREVGKSDITGVALDGEDVAVDAHHQRRHRVMAVVVQAPLGHVAAVRQPVEITPHDTYSTISHGCQR